MLPPVLKKLGASAARFFNHGEAQFLDCFRERLGVRKLTKNERYSCGSTAEWSNGAMVLAMRNVLNFHRLDAATKLEGIAHGVLITPLSGNSRCEQRNLRGGITLLVLGAARHRDTQKNQA